VSSHVPDLGGNVILGSESGNKLGEPLLVLFGTVEDLGSG